jgi:hypothetical protein
MIAVDTNVLVGAIQTFDPQLRITARRAVKALYRQGVGPVRQKTLRRWAGEMFRSSADHASRMEKWTQRYNGIEA